MTDLDLYVKPTKKIKKIFRIVTSIPKERGVFFFFISLEIQENVLNDRKGIAISY